ncbi:CLUMA_CG002241, isoform A [Clunio marinus]|uniref:Beta-hexosaminidase n=1 Tax=Clunio marinus TaxID=568069 RepID=A0A1J1HQF6_9DIPT|nr:CLUMA_CG002241, isoform A [Clunio marinus]
MKLNYFIIFFTSLVMISSGYIIDYGPVVKATKGAIWPHPKSQASSVNFNTIRPTVFNFDIVGSTCDILEKALERYKNIILIQLRKVRFRVTNTPLDNKWRNVPEYLGHIDSVKIDLKTKCEKNPYLGMDESYKITISQSKGTIEAYSIWGMLRGVESFSQLLYVAPDARSLVINETQVVDEPRFPHRGLLVDTSRHFVSMPVLEQILDGMAYNKLNVFHWHIVDDHSFPYQSIKYPELTQGAFHESMIYSQKDVARIIEYARLRGIRVMPEFDTPGHTRSWGASHPELLTKCGGPYTGKLGPINPIIDSNYDFLFNLFEEIGEVFPDLFVHLGGDEVGFECWETNQDIIDYMKTFNITSFANLEEFYIQKLIDKISRLDKLTSVVWQEVYTNGARLPKGTLVHIWTGDQKKLLSRVTKDKLPALLSTCWYLDHLSTGGDWVKFYNCDPHNFPGTDEQKKLVIGGEACIRWGEVVDDSNIIQRIFPRVCATAEKLWSQKEITNVDAAMKRLEEHYCRMRHRNINAQPPSGPGLCL